MKRSAELDKEYISLKPVFNLNNRSNPPYYDPIDLHIHNFKDGKLGLVENPKVPTFNNGKINIKNCTYCKVCHITKDPFQSTVCNNKDIITDILYNPYVNDPCVQSYQNSDSSSMNIDLSSMNINSSSGISVIVSEYNPKTVIDNIDSSSMILKIINNDRLFMAIKGIKDTETYFKISSDDHNHHMHNE
jgi:hypothetical protein